MKHPFPALLILLLYTCGDPIKNTGAAVLVEPGTDTTTGQAALAQTATPAASEDYLGYWVGYFQPDYADVNQPDRSVAVDDGFIWERENKINISIDHITGDSVFGHSVVAGNDRPFSGVITEKSYTETRFSVREPGDDRYDGAFEFMILDDELSGTWEAYKSIAIPKRRYELSRQTFAYDPDQPLVAAGPYVDWTNFTETPASEEYDGEVYTWMDRTFASATPVIYEINASNQTLTKADLENLKRGDLVIIRNTIYARHGYSFRNRPLRVFFDAQPWYIPVHADIRADFTDLEKENIKLLLTYEGNAAEYYDRFGRG